MRILPHAQEEPIAKCLNEAIVSTLVRAATHKEPAETALSDASATARSLGRYPRDAARKLFEQECRKSVRGERDPRGALPN